MVKLALKGGKKTRVKPLPSWPIYGEKEKEELVNVLKSGNWSYYAHHHEKQTEFERKFSRLHDSDYAICTSSGSASLEVALRAAGVGYRDEVIVPALTFVATASAAWMVGAIPVFVDIDPETYCIDSSKIEDALTERTKAIIPVHLYSNIANMDKIKVVADSHNLEIIEDCSHAHGAKWRSKGVGSIGDAGCFSFQQSKPVTSGEGGIIVTNNKKIEEFSRAYVNCGRTAEDFRYVGNMLGWNYRITEFQAAILIGQLERLPEQMALREKNASYLSEQLSKIEGIRPLKKTEGVTRRAYYQFIFQYNPEAFSDVSKERFLEALQFEGIPCGSTDEPVYKSPLFTIETGRFPQNGRNRPDYSQVLCPVAEKAYSEEGVSLFHSMLLGNREDIDDVINAIRKIRENLDELKAQDSGLTKARRLMNRYLADLSDKF